MKCALDSVLRGDVIHQKPLFYVSQQKSYRPYKTEKKFDFAENRSFGHFDSL